MDDLDAEDAEATQTNVLGQELGRCISVDSSWLTGGPLELQQAVQALETIVPASDQVDLSDDGLHSSYGLVQAPRCCLNASQLAKLQQAVLDALKYHMGAELTTQAEATKQPDLVRSLLFT